MTTATPFRIEVGDDAIEDLKSRLLNARWPDQVNDEDWSYGTELNYLRELADYWVNEYDWRQHEARLNAFDQFLLNIDGLETHFIHQRSPHENATPLLITHGWPGSIVEFLHVIPRLTAPEKFGGRPEDAFHVVAPSLPGYGFSAAAREPGMNTRAIARRQIELMELLGYSHYVAQGGDWGAMVTRHVADLDPQHCLGIHLNLVLAGPPADADDPMAGLSEKEKARLERNRLFTEDGMGYFRIQSTRPQTLGYALNDSPLGLCAWVAEKFHAWTDCDGEIRNAVSWDDLLTNISLYWFSGSITSSARLYLEDTRYNESPERIDIPTGAAIFPKELFAPPRAWVESSYNLVHWFEAERGGHFAALEQPEVFAKDLWEFKKML